MRMSLKNLTYIGVCTALLCVLAPLTIPIGAVPISLSVFAVFVISGILKKEQAVVCCLLYLFLGSIGLPVFAGFRSGVGILMGPTGGYLLSYPIMALIIGFFLELFRSKKIFSLIVSFLAALLFCYLLGTLWFSIAMNREFFSSLAITVLPFIGFDLMKRAVAVIVVNRMDKILKLSYV